MGGRKSITWVASASHGLPKQEMKQQQAQVHLGWYLRGLPFLMLLNTLSTKPFRTHPTNCCLGKSCTPAIQCLPSPQYHFHSPLLAYFSSDILIFWLLPSDSSFCYPVFNPAQFSVFLHMTENTNLCQNVNNFPFLRHMPFSCETMLASYRTGPGVG